MPGNRPPVPSYPPTINKPGAVNKPGAEPPCYIPPEEVVFAWIIYYAARFEGRRAPLKWLIAKTKLSKNTVTKWRKEYFAQLHAAHTKPEGDAL